MKLGTGGLASHLLAHIEHSKQLGIDWPETVIGTPRVPDGHVVWPYRAEAFLMNAYDLAGIAVEAEQVLELRVLWETA